MMTTETFNVTFVSGVSESIEKVKSNILREGGSVSSVDSALVHIKKALEAPRCCKKVGNKVAGLNEELEDKKKELWVSEYKLGRVEEEIGRQQEKIETLTKEVSLTHPYISQLSLACTNKPQLAETKIEQELGEQRHNKDGTQLVNVMNDLVLMQAALEAMTMKAEIAAAQLTATKSELQASEEKFAEHSVITMQLDTELNDLVAKEGAVASIAAELTAVRSELEAVKKEKKEMGAKNARVVASKNGQLASLKKDLKAKEKEAQEYQPTAVQLAAVKEELEASKKEAQEYKQTIAQAIAAKNSIEVHNKAITQQLAVTKDDLDVAWKSAHDTQQALDIVTAELNATKKQSRPQKHLSNQLEALKVKLTAAEEASTTHQQAAYTANMQVNEAYHNYNQIQNAYTNAQHTINNLQNKVSSLQSTLDLTGEDLRTVRHDLTAATADATVRAEDLATEKKTNMRLASELSQAQTTSTDLRSQLDILKVELAAYKKPSTPAVTPPKSVRAPASPPQSAAEKMAAWGNAQAVVRANDQTVRLANAPKAAAMKDEPAGEWRETFRATGAGKAKQSKMDVVRSLLDDVEKEKDAADAQVSALKEALGEEKAAGVERERELAAARRALESCQGSLREAHRDLAAAAAAKAGSCGSCTDLERSLRHARAGADAALMQLDEVHYKCMSTWSVLHDVTWDVECKLSVREGTPELVSSSHVDGDSEEEEEEEELEVVGGDGEVPPVWDRNTPPHLRRRGGFAGRSLARHMPGLVRK